MNKTFPNNTRIYLSIFLQRLGQACVYLKVSAYLRGGNRRPTRVWKLTPPNKPALIASYVTSTINSISKNTQQQVLPSSPQRKGLEQRQKGIYHLPKEFLAAMTSDSEWHSSEDDEYANSRRVSQIFKPVCSFVFMDRNHRHANQRGGKSRRKGEQKP